MTQTETTVTDPAIAAESTTEQEPAATDTSTETSASKRKSKRQPEPSTRFVKGGGKEKPLNIIGHEWLNKAWNRMLTALIRSLGNTLRQPGEKASPGDVRAILNLDDTLTGDRVVSVDVFAAPPFGGGRSAKGAKTFEVIPPTWEDGGKALYVVRDGRHLYKAKAPKKDAPAVTSDGKAIETLHQSIARRWRVHLNVQRFRNSMDRESKRPRKAAAILADMFVAACHIRAANIGRNATVTNYLKGLGFGPGTGPNGKQTWTILNVNDHLKKIIRDIVQDIGEVPEGLLMDYTAFANWQDPNAKPKLTPFACPVKVKVQTSKKDPKTGKTVKATEERPCPLGRWQIPTGAVEVMLKAKALSKIICPLHGKVMVPQEKVTKTTDERHVDAMEG